MVYCNHKVTPHVFPSWNRYAVSLAVIRHQVTLGEESRGEYHPDI